MDGFKLFLMTKNRFRLLAFAGLVTAASAVSSASEAAEGGNPGKPAVTQDQLVAKRAAAAIKARAQRDAAVKRRVEAQKYIQKVVEGQQPGGDKAGGATQ